MPHAPFVHLRTHTAFSLSEGAIRLDALVDRCREQAMPAVAITDTNNLFGALEFALTASAAGVQPIVGCQLAIAREGEGGPLRTATPETDQLVLLVQDEAGYRNLLDLVSRAYLDAADAHDPHLALADLDGCTDGLLALTGGPAGGVGRLLAEGQGDAAGDYLGRLQSLFPGRLYVELQRHGVAVEDRIEGALVDLAVARELPLVATNEAFFLDADEYEAHDALLCIADGAYLGQAERRRCTPEHRFKTAEEMAALFQDLPEAVANTVAIARRCAFMPEARDPILPPFATESGHTEGEEMRLQAEAGLADRLAAITVADETPEAREERERPYRERLSFELEVIEKMGYSGYFLIVADFIKWAKARGIPVGPGRGSGAGSVAAWALTITDLDPLRFNLLFERFLNMDRISMPDFDIDFCQDRRDEVIDYVQAKYGHDRVAQIITFGKLQARAVLRDVGRVMELGYNRVDRICKLVPNNPANPVTLQQAIDGEPALQEMQREDEAIGRLIRVSLKLEGLYRHASTHAAGVVIGDRPLKELIPLYRDTRSEMAVTQFSMKFVEKAGLVKFDFLGLKTLTVLKRAVDLLARRGVEIDIGALPLDDAQPFDMMSRGDTMGVFQFEGSGMRQLLREARVNNFEDIIALVALFRPGPMENIPKYVACKYEREKPEFLHETIEPVVADTYGVIIYQEQVMQIAQVFAGFTLGHADVLRNAMGKKIKSEMAAQREHFVDGAMARGVPRERAEYVFDLVDKFAGYGFNKAHSTGYALVAYQTAYLKANHPVEFLAASMTLDMGNTDRLAGFRRELDRLGIPLLPPDVNRSEATFAVEDVDDDKLGIRYALGAIKGVGRAAMEAIVAERTANGAYRDLADLAARLDAKVVNKRQIETLAAAGAFDGLNPNRAQVFGAAELVMRHAHAAQEDRDSGQVSLFGGGDEITAEPLRLPPRDDWPGAERLQQELDAIGFYLSAHPLDDYAKRLERIGAIASSDVHATVEAQGGGAMVKLAGTMLAKSERTARSGARFAFVTCSDTSGVYEVVMFSEVLAQARDLLDAGRPMLLWVGASLEGEQLSLRAQKVEDLDEATADAAAGLKLWLDDAGPLASLRERIDRFAHNGNGRGRGQIRLVVPAEDEEVELRLPGGYVCTPQVRAALKDVAGVLKVEEV